MVLLFVGFLVVVSANVEWHSLGGMKGQPVETEILDDNASETVIEFKVAGYNLETVDIHGQAYSVVTLPKAVTFLEKGLPQLPRISESIIIPDDAHMTCEILEAEYETMRIAPVAPSKGSLLRSVDPKTVPYTFSDFYQQDTFWPREIVELSDPFIMRDFRGITVRFNLFRHNAVKGELQVCKRLVVKIKPDGSGIINVKSKPRGKVETNFQKIYERFFLNFSQNINNGLGKAAYQDISEQGRMLIIAADDYYDSMLPLARWKTRKGFLTELVKCSDVGTTREAVKSYIQNKYDTEGVAFILLVGDGDNALIPSKGVPYAEGDTVNAYLAIADPMYTILEGSDYYPDAFISRFSAETVDQVENQVWRTINYEMTPLSGSWFNRGTGIASDCGDPKDWERCNWLRDDLLGYTYTNVDQIYDPGATKAQVTNALNNGRSILNYIGHGGSYGWSTTGFSNSDVFALSNTNMLPFIISVACYGGDFPGKTCFGEAWLRAGSADNPKGAIASYNSSISQRWVEPTIAQAEAVDLLVSESKNTVGGLCFNGSCYMIEQYGAKGIDQFETWHIFGDASTQVWTDTPSQFANVSITDNGTSITVNSGVSGCDICICSSDNGAGIYSVAYDASSLFLSTSARPLYITITKPNYIPYTAVTGGTFTSDEVWFGNMNVLSGCSFTSDASLTILPGTKVLMDGYFNLAFLDNARLIAEGTEEAPIVFTSSNGTSPQSWKYLYIRTSNNVLRHCEVKYGNWAIFMIGYPSSGNVVENCTIHDNDQGIRMENNEVDITNCDIYNNRHNMVTMYNAEINIEGTHIHDGGRDGIYCYSADLLNIYGSVIEDNGNGGTSTRNGIYSRYADVINIGKLSYPAWSGYNTIRNNYNNEVYSYYGNSQVEIRYNSIHDDSGYEVYNYSSNPGIVAMYCWWGEYPPDISQFYGDVLVIKNMSSQPSWAGQTRSGGLSKAAIPVTVNNESPEERITKLKNQITSNYRSNNADTALTELFKLIRSDYVDNHYRERENFYSFLLQVYNKAKNYTAGKRALQYMILWKILENDKKSAIDLSQQGLTILDEPDQMGVMGNLVYLYAYTNQFKQAHQLLKRYTDQYKFDNDGIEFLTESVEAIEEMYEEEKRLAKDNTPPEDESITTVMPDKFALEPAYPNPFNATTVISYQLPEESRVKICIYNINGQLVQTLVNDRQTAGYYSVNWNSVGLASGIYFYQIVAGDFRQIHKCMLIK